APPVTTSEIQAEVLRFVMQHPGCVDARAERRRYSDRFRCFVLELRDRHSKIDLAPFARAVRVALGTLEEWLRLGAPAADAPAADEPTKTKEASSRADALAAAWERWEGDLASFVEHAHRDLHRPEGRTAIATLLAELGVR